MTTEMPGILRHLPIIAVEFDIQLNTTDHSPSFDQWIQHDDVTGRRLSELMPESLYLQLDKHLSKAQAGHYAECTVALSATAANPSGGSYRVCIMPEGSYAPAKLLLTAVSLSKGNTQATLYENLSYALDTLNQGLAIYDDQLRLLVWNKAFEQMGIFPKKFIQYNVSLKDVTYIMAKKGVFGEGDPDELAELYIDKIRTQRLATEEELYPPTGRIIKIRRYYLAGGGVFATFTDITDQKNYEKRLIEQANLDSLTQIPNRHSIMKTLVSHTQNQDDPDVFHLLFIDLDRFKLINDTYGHHVGDHLLLETVRRLREKINESQGDIVARMGGDEFVIMLKSVVTRTEVDAVCRAVLKALESPFYIEGFTIFISCSIGVSGFPSECETCHGVISQADTAMYHAKMEGRNTFQHYTTALGERLTKRALIANTLRRHLHNNASPIYLVFQPIVDLESGQAVAAEVLLRWGNLEKYHVTIHELVGIIEEHGMIMEVGNHIIDLSISSLHQLLKYDRDAPFYLSINASPIQVTQKGFGEDFIKSFSNEHLSAEFIALEITESALMQNTDIVLENLNMIREAGFNLAIDDFGTGYSSLSYLEKYPFTHLKIDKSFIDHIPGNNQKTHLLHAIMDISRAFDMKVIAEGIESREQMDYLKDIGCHLGQGYYFGKPESLQQFHQRLQ